MNISGEAVKAAAISRDEIEKEVQDLRERLLEIREREDEGMFPSEDAMETASITVRLAKLWDVWQAANWECAK